MKKCKYCNKTDFKSAQSFGAHISNCKLNPNYFSKKIKISNTRKEKNPKTEYQFNCVKCNNIYFVVLSLNDFKNKKYRTHCTRKCANSHNITEDIKNKISLKNTGKQYPTRRKYIYIEQICKCGKQLCKTNKSGFCKNCLLKDTDGKKYVSNKLKGKTGGYRVKGGNSQHKSQYYNNVWMQSSWEVKMAERLDFLKINWNRNSQIFLKWVDDQNIEHKYYPDFYLNDYDIYLEIKGYMTENNKIKMQKVLEQHKINLIMLRDIKSIENFIV